MKHTLIAAMIAIIAAFSMSSAAQAGKWKGKGFKFKKFHHHYFVKKVYHGKLCYKYKKLFYKTGNKFWLRKYKICRYY